MNAVSGLGEEQWKIEMTYSFITPEIFALFLSKFAIAYFDKCPTMKKGCIHNIYYFVILNILQLCCGVFKIIKKYQADLEKALRAFVNLLHEPLEQGLTNCPGAL